MCAVKSIVSGIEMGLVFLTIMGSPVFLSTLTLLYSSLSSPETCWTRSSWTRRYSGAAIIVLLIDWLECFLQEQQADGSRAVGSLKYRERAFSTVSSMILASGMILIPSISLTLSNGVASQPSQVWTSRVLTWKSESYSAWRAAPWIVLFKVNMW